MTEPTPRATPMHDVIHIPTAVCRVLATGFPKSDHVITIAQTPLSGVNIELANQIPGNSWLLVFDWPIRY